jgi:hypothetical protein
MYYSKAHRRRPKLPRDVRRHFLRRLKERYAIVITMKECKKLEKHSFKFFIERENSSHWWYLLKIKDRWVYCLFEKRYGLTTVLTPQQFWSNHPGWRLRSPGHICEPYKDAWTASREDQKKYQPRQVLKP